MKSMKTEIRIVAGALRGRKLACTVNPELRPTPQRVREAYFSIMGNAIPDRLFVDVFAGTGVVGLEAISRGASMTYFIERDLRNAQDIDKHLRAFGVAKQAKIFRTDAYRWIAAWQPPPEPVNVFLSPPFPDLQHRPEVMREALARLQASVPPDSVIVLQSERDSGLEDHADMADWEERIYGRNVLLIWQKEEPVVRNPSGIATQPSATPDA